MFIKKKKNVFISCYLEQICTTWTLLWESEKKKKEGGGGSKH